MLKPPPVYNPFGKTQQRSVPGTGQPGLHHPPAYRPVAAPTRAAVQEKPGGTIQRATCPQCKSNAFNGNRCAKCGYSSGPAATPYGFDPAAESARASGGYRNAQIDRPNPGCARNMLDGEDDSN